MNLVSLFEEDIFGEPLMNFPYLMKLLFLITLLSSTSFAFSQTPIDITESTLKVNGLGEETIYYGLAAGDKLVFNFEELKGKDIKEIEITQYGTSSSKFFDYKAKKIDNKTINISETGIYAFRFKNTAAAGRICRFHIQRIPLDESSKNFNTNVYWRTVFDTTYYTVQERYLVRTDTIIHNITNQVAKVHSQLNLNGAKTTFNFTLPENTVAWSYYVGVDQNGQEAYENATKLLATKAAPLVAKIPSYGPLAALALGGSHYIATLQRGEDIDYYIVDNSNISLFNAGQQFYYIKKGKVINDFSRMTTNLKGTYHFCLINDNTLMGVSVTVKVVAIQVNQIWGIRPVQKTSVSSRDEAYLKN